MKKVTRRSEEQIKQILSTQRTSGLSVKTFCIRNQVCESTFWNWRKRFGKYKNTLATQKPVKFLEVAHIPIVTPYEIEIQMGPAIVRVKRGCDNQLLTMILSTLAQIYSKSLEATACK